VIGELVLKSESAIERQILGYWQENPDGQDTLEGITSWWLLRQRITQSLAAIERALKKLVRQGKVIVSKGADGQVRYRRSNENMGRSKRNGRSVGQRA
jgi:hypothetical protein